MNPSSPADGSLGDRFHQVAKTQPLKPALICGSDVLTYETLDLAVTGLAQWFLNEGIKPGDRVGIYWFNEIPPVILYLACFRVGLIAVPINWRMKAPEITYVLGHAKPVILFAHPRLVPVAEEARQAGSHFCRILDAIPAGPPGGTVRELPRTGPDETAIIIYTSGTTARPKGAAHTHRTLTASARMMWDIGPVGISVTSTSIMHPSGLLCVLLPPLLAGGALVLIPTFDPAAMLDAIERHRCTNCIFLPSMAQFAVVEQNRRPRDVSSLQWIIAGGDSVPVELQKQFRAAFGIILREGIAMTECCPMLANSPEAMKTGSVGRPLPGVEARVASSAGGPAPDGEVGELVVRSPTVFAGYWEDPVETAAALHDGWLFTGDLVKRDADGYYWFQGRKKQIIVRESFNIAPQEVEEVLYQHPAVFEAGVFGWPDPQYGEKVIASVSLRPGATATEVELRDFVKTHLNDLKVPERVLFAAELPKGISGKIDRRALKEMARDCLSAAP